MEGKKKRNLQQLMRSLHRDVGFLVIGMTLIYAVSGILLLYRDTNLMKFEKQIERQLEPNLEDDQIGGALRMRFFEIEKVDGDLVYFNNGTYNRSTGAAQYIQIGLPDFLNKINGLHKSSSRSVSHWFAAIFAVLLLFLALSSFWMFTAKSKNFKRGIVFSVIGLLMAVVMLSL